MSHLCILFAYKNVQHIKQCFESLYLSEIDFWVIENNSENSEEIQEYFTSDGKIKKYFYFEENITSNAVQKILNDFSSLILQYDFLTITDCDLVVDDARSAFNEIIKNASLEEVGISCIDLKLENLPLDIPGAAGWLPFVPEEKKTKEYVESLTGVHLMTTRNEMIKILLISPHIVDSAIFAQTKSQNKKWVKTINNKAYHLTWDLYRIGNPYYIEKTAMTYESWHHSRMCEYKEII